MKLTGKVCIVTGAASGIGLAVAERIAAERPAGLVLSDLDAPALEAGAARLGALAVAGDAGAEADVRRLIECARERHGRVDCFVANAGVMRGRGLGPPPGGPFASDETWAESWAVNVMGHVFATRALLPEWLERGAGCFVSIASAAGLLTELGSAAYSVTKHAAVGFAEWLAVSYGARGVRVCCVCPLGVDTPMVTDEPIAVDHLVDGMIPPAAVAEALLEGLAAERFLILPHPDAARFIDHKGSDTDRWIAGMQRLRTTLYG